MTSQGRPPEPASSANYQDAQLSVSSCPSTGPQVPRSPTFATRQEKVEAMEDRQIHRYQTTGIVYKVTPASSSRMPAPNVPSRPLSGNREAIPPPSSWSTRPIRSPPPTQAELSHLSTTRQRGWQISTPYTFAPQPFQPNATAQRSLVPLSTPSHASVPSMVRQHGSPSTTSSVTTPASASSTQSCPPFLSTTIRRESQVSSLPTQADVTELSSGSSEQEAEDIRSRQKRRKRAQSQNEKPVKKSKEASCTSAVPKKGRGGRQPGAFNWRLEEDICVVDIFHDRSPVSSSEMKECAKLYNIWANANGYPQREGDKLKKRVDKVLAVAAYFSFANAARLSKSLKPADGPLPKHIEKAMQIKPRIQARLKAIIDDAQEDESETVSTHHSESDLSAVEEVSKEQGKEKGKEKEIYQPDQDPTRKPADRPKPAVKPWRATAAAAAAEEARVQHVSARPPETRAEHSADLPDQCMANALALNQIYHLQQTICVLQAKIDDLERLLRRSRDETYAAQRAADRAEAKLDMQSMLLQMYGNGSRLPFFPTLSSPSQIPHHHSSLDMTDTACESMPSSSRAIRSSSSLPLQTPGAGPSDSAPHRIPCSREPSDS